MLQKIKIISQNKEVTMVIVVRLLSYCLPCTNFFFGRLKMGPWPETRKETKKHKDGL